MELRIGLGFVNIHTVSTVTSGVYSQA